MQVQRAASDAAQVRIAYDDALVLVSHECAKGILKAGEALGVLEQGLEREEVLYVHQLFQEYFAARRLAAASEPGLVQVEWLCSDAASFVIGHAMTVDGGYVAQ